MTKNKTIKGYKVFEPNWTCRGFQYEIGKTYTMKEKPSLCSQGFHFCTNLADCFKYYENNPKNKIAEVVALGECTEQEDNCSKIATNKIKIVKEISFEEAYKIGNQGQDNTGFGNTGDRNTGNWNTGDWNTGYRNTGDSNTGDSNTGYRNTGDRNTGYRNTGDRNTGDWNTGDWNTGYRNTGDRNTGYRNTGDRNTGYRNTGDRNTGNYNSANYCTGMFNTIEQPIYLFNQPTEFTREEFKNIFPEQYNLLFYSYLPLTEWVVSNEMSDKEKENYPEYETTGGFLKKNTYYEAWLKMWSSWTKEQQNSIKKLPNFDKDIFKEITGIEIN